MMLKPMLRKLSQILRRNDVARVTIAHMEVPCCSGLWWVVDKAVHAAGKDIPVRRYVVTVAVRSMRSEYGKR